MCTWSPRREDRKNEGEKLYKEIMTDNLSNLVKDTNVEILKAQQTPGNINAKKIMPRNNILKLLKTKDKILKVTRVNNILYTWKQ